MLERRKVGKKVRMQYARSKMQDRKTKAGIKLLIFEAGTRHTTNAKFSNETPINRATGVKEFEWTSIDHSKNTP